MSIRVVPIAKEAGLRHCSTAPNFHNLPTPPPRRRQSVAELLVPKRKESRTFFVSPQRNRKNVTWRATSTHDAIRPPLSKTFTRTLKKDLKDETRVTPRQPKRQNGMVRLTPTPKNRTRREILVLPRLSRPLV